MDRKTIIDDETFDNLLYLSRLSPDATSRETLAAQVSRIVDYFEVLSKYAGDENPYDAYPTAQVGELRGNDVEERMESGDLRKMTESFIDGYFRVPKVLGGGA